MFSEPHYLPDPWLIALGKVTQSWASFEQTFNLMLQKLAGYDDPFDPTFTILVAHSSLPQRLDMFASLCAAYSETEPHLAAYKDVIGQIREAQSVRNRFSHNVIGIEEADPTRARLMVISARGKLKQEVRKVSLREAEEASDKILQAARSLYKLVLQPKQ